MLADKTDHSHQAIFPSFTYKIATEKGVGKLHRYKIYPTLMTNTQSMTNDNSSVSDASIQDGISIIKKLGSFFYGKIWYKVCIQVGARVPWWLSQIRFSIQKWSIFRQMFGTRLPFYCRIFFGATPNRRARNWTQCLLHEMKTWPLLTDALWDLYDHTIGCQQFSTCYHFWQDFCEAVDWYHNMSQETLSLCDFKRWDNCRYQDVVNILPVS